MQATKEQDVCTVSVIYCANDPQLVNYIVESLKADQRVELNYQERNVVIEVWATEYPTDVRLSYKWTQLRFKEDGSDSSGLNRLREEIRRITNGAVAMWWNPGGEPQGSDDIKNVHLAANGALKDLSTTVDYQQLICEQMPVALQYILAQMSSEKRVNFTCKV